MAGAVEVSEIRAPVFARVTLVPRIAGTYCLGGVAGLNGAGSGTVARLAVKLRANDAAVRPEMELVAHALSRRSVEDT